MTQSVQGLRAAVYDVCTTLYDGERDSAGGKVQVVRGIPTSYIAPYVVMIGKDARQIITRPTMSGGSSRRTREREVDLTITFSLWVPGDEDNQQDAIDEHDRLVDLLEGYLCTPPNEALGGACRDAYLSAIDGPTLDVSRDGDNEDAITGHIVESVATVKSYIRY